MFQFSENRIVRPELMSINATDIKLWIEKALRLLFTHDELSKGFFYLNPTWKGQFFTALNKKYSSHQLSEGEVICIAEGVCLHVRKLLAILAN